MFVVRAAVQGSCIACGKETECFDVESPGQAIVGLLCPQDFRKQVKIATATQGSLPHEEKEEKR